MKNTKTEALKELEKRFQYEGGGRWQETLESIQSHKDHGLTDFISDLWDKAEKVGYEKGFAVWADAWKKENSKYSKNKIVGIITSNGSIEPVLAKLEAKK